MAKSAAAVALQQSCILRMTGRVIIGLVDEGGEIAEKFAGSSEIDRLLISLLLEGRVPGDRGLRACIRVGDAAAGELLAKILAEEIAAAWTLGELARSFREAQMSGETDCEDDMEESRRVC